MDAPPIGLARLANVHCYMPKGDVLVTELYVAICMATNDRALARSQYHAAIGLAAAVYEGEKDVLRTVLSPRIGELAHVPQKGDRRRHRRPAPKPDRTLDESLMIEFSWRFFPIGREVTAFCELVPHVYVLSHIGRKGPNLERVRKNVCRVRVGYVLHPTPSFSGTAIAAFWSVFPKTPVSQARVRRSLR